MVLNAEPEKPQVSGNPSLGPLPSCPPRASSCCIILRVHTLAHAQGPTTGHSISQAPRATTIADPGPRAGDARAAAVAAAQMAGQTGAAPRTQHGALAPAAAHMAARRALAFNFRGRCATAPPWLAANEALSIGALVPLIYCPTHMSHPQPRCPVRCGTQWRWAAMSLQYR